MYIITKLSVHKKVFQQDTNIEIQSDLVHMHVNHFMLINMKIFC